MTSQAAHDEAVKRPLISIVIAVMNGAKVLARCLDSIAAQTCKDFEVVLADGVSTDGTLDIIRDYAARGVLTRWHTEKDHGVYDAWNKILPEARGTWICFLGADDQLADPTVLERLAAVLRKEPQQTIVYGKLNIVSEDGQVLDPIVRPWAELKKAFLAGRTMIPHPGCFHHRSIFERHGSFDSVYRIAGDYDVMLRELRNSDALYLPDIVTVNMQIGGISGKPENLLLGMLEIRRARNTNRIPGIAWRLNFKILLARVGIVVYRIAGPRALHLLSDLYRIVTFRKRKWTV